MRSRGLEVLGAWWGAGAGRGRERSDLKAGLGNEEAKKKTKK